MFIANVRPAYIKACKKSARNKSRAINKLLKKELDMTFSDSESLEEEESEDENSTDSIVTEEGVNLQSEVEPL